MEPIWPENHCMYANKRSRYIYQPECIGEKSKRSTSATDSASKVLPQLRYRSHHKNGLHPAGQSVKHSLGIASKFIQCMYYSQATMDSSRTLSHRRMTHPSPPGRKAAGGTAVAYPNYESEVMITIAQVNMKFDDPALLVRR